MQISGNLPNAQYSRFESLREYEAVIDNLIPQTQQVIRVFDKTLSRGYNSLQRCEALRNFLLRSRSNRLIIVLHEAEAVRRDCPRMVELLRRFSHAMSIRQTLRAAQRAHDPFVIFDASHYVHRFHYDHLRAARGSNDLEGTQVLLERFSEIFEASAPAIPANVSGL
jgi:hypothetical protein